MLDFVAMLLGYFDIIVIIAILIIGIPYYIRELKNNLKIRKAEKEIEEKENFKRTVDEAVKKAIEQKINLDK